MSKHEYAGELPFWYDGKSVNEVGFCEEFLQQHPMVCVWAAVSSPRMAVSPMKKVSARKSMKCFALFSPAALPNGHRGFWKW